LKVEYCQLIIVYINNHLKTKFTNGLNCNLEAPPF